MFQQLFKRSTTLRYLIQRSALLSALGDKKGVLKNAPSSDQDTSNPGDVTTLHLKSHNGIDIVLTPLVVFASIHFEEDIKRSVRFPDLDVVNTKSNGA